MRHRLEKLGLVFFLFLISQHLVAQQVSVTKTVSTSTPLTGEQITYEISFGCSSLDADCVNAIIRDTLPAELIYDSADPIIVTGVGGATAITPTYDAASHSLTYDFSVIVPEGGLPDGYSGTASFNMTVPAGSTPNGASISNTARIVSDNAGNDADTAYITPQASPDWSLTKSVSGMIYHDRDITYILSLCSGSTNGNLDLHNITVRDTLPAGADYVSSNLGGVWDGNDPGIVTWTLDTMKVTDPCTNFTVTVEYPSSDLVNNNTGLSTSIPKENKAVATGTPVGEPLLTLNDQINDALLPPVFTLTGSKTENDDGILPLGTRNYFTVLASNSGTAPVNNFVLYDSIHAQFDLMYIRFTGAMGDSTVTVRAYLNGNSTPVAWITTTIGHSDLDSLSVNSITGFNPMIDYVSGVEFDFGTVPDGFSESIRLVVSPAYDDSGGPAVDNAGNPVFLDSVYQNCSQITAIRPLDGATIGPIISCADMCIVDTVARLAPVKTQASTNQNLPPGSATTGNPYLPGSQVTYTIRLENDGDDDVTTDDDGATAFAALSNPIGSDLLPMGMTYQTSSYSISANGTGLTLDNGGTNPTFEQIDNFNGTGRTLLRWQFTGDFEIGEYVEIQFDADIDTTSGATMTNKFCLSAAQDFICEDVDCGAQDTTGLNNLFGQTGDPSMLIAGISQACCDSTSFTVADSVTVIDGSKGLLTSSPYAPAGTDLAELGLANDTLEFEVALRNDVMANVELPNPIAMDLLPSQLEFVSGSMSLTSDDTGLGFSDDGSNPAIEVIQNFSGTGRTLVRWTFSGDFPINTGVTFRFKTYIKPGENGIITNDFLYNSEDQFYNCNSGVSVADTLDLDEDADVAELLCRSVAPNATIQTVASMAATKFVKGILDTGYLQLPDTATTLPGDSVLWRLVISNPGNVDLTDVVIVDVLPYIGDVGVQLNTTGRGTGWRPFFTDTIAYPINRTDVTIEYSQQQNPCRSEINPISSAGCVNDWGSPPADLSTIQAIKIELSDTLKAAESFTLDLKMEAPDSSGITNPLAWNSLARNAAEIPAQEPNKVGIRLKYFDLALTKTLASGQSASIETKDTIDFTINVINQGCFSVDSITITDYIPFPFLRLYDTDWTSVNDSTATILLPGILAPNATTSVDITMIVADSVAGDMITNFAEILSATDSLNNIVTDFDSTPDNDRNNDDNSIDDNIDGGNADEDDHDGEQITIQNCTVNYTFTTECLDNSTPLNPLDDQFNITVTPSGMSNGTNYTISNSHGFSRTLMYPTGYMSSGDTTFMAVMGGFNLTISDDENPGCTFTDTIPPPAPCSVIDLAITKTIDTTCASPGDTVTYTVLLVKEIWDVKIDTVDVLDTLPTGLTYVSHVVSQGTYNSGTGMWNLGTLYEGTDTFTLTIGARVNDFLDGGTLTNQAEVNYVSTGDIDSTPNNNTSSEDDIDYMPVNIPTYICPDLNDSLLISAPAGSTNVMWFRDIGGGPVLVGSGLTYMAGDSGTYTFTADVNLCPGGVCAPTYVREGCFDLALKKTLATGQTDTINPGDSARFTITIYNQGDFDAYDIDIIDFLPDSMNLDDSNWATQGDTSALRTITGPLAAGDSVSVDIQLDLPLSYMDSVQVNFAEIADATDRPGGTTKPDRDSSPDQDSTNDVFGGDNVTDNTGSDEDDHDPDTIFVRQIFDLALKKTLATGQSSNVRPGDTATFTLTVYNQGTLNAYDILIADYLTDSLNLVDPNWTQSNDTAYITIDSILARDSFMVDIDLRVDTAFTGSTLTNYAEINFATEHDGSGFNTPDLDSQADNNNSNDTGGTPGNPAEDDVVTDDGTIDEDDADPAQISVLQCMVTATLVTSLCDNNSTGSIVSDDYYIVTVSATAVDPGSSGRYEVVLNNMVLNPGGTLYGQNTVCGTGMEFLADNSTIYTLIIRDIDLPDCFDNSVTVGPLPNCLICGAQKCLPAEIQIIRPILKE